jgi:tetratricopeptide (TPR) repeat protein
VLVLRTGLGLKHGYTRREVARILHVTLKREGELERQATVALLTASVHSGCGNPVPAIQTAVLRTLNAVLASTPLAGLGSSSGSSLASSSATTTGRPRAAAARPSGHASGAPGASVSQPPAPASAAIAPPPEAGVNWLLIVLALVILLGLVALWFTFSRAIEGDGAAVAHRHRLRDYRRTVTGAFDPARFRRAAGVLPAAVGLVALRNAAATRVPNRRAARLDRRGNPDPAPAPFPAHTANGHIDEPARERQPNGQIRAPAARASAAAGVEVFELGAALAEKGDNAGAEAAYRQADEQGHPSAASNLGVMLEERGDLAGAEAAYRRADERGDPNGAFNLASMLADRGDLAGAEAAFHRAAQRGDTGAMFNLGVLRERRNDLFGAEAAYRRADEGGHATAATHLGMLLESREDPAGAEAAYRRADDRGDAVGAFKLGGLLEKRQDLRGAEAAYARAAERGGSYVTDLAQAALSLLRSGR